MTETEFNSFLSTGPNVLVAPAGYGKTHTIARSVKALHSTTGRSILVLTHTNAGITSIKQKFAKEKTGVTGVEIYTIAGFLQKIVHNLSRKQIEQTGDSNSFYAALYKEAEDLFLHNIILKSVIERSFEHIFIDEYQDCNSKQYSIIKILASWDLKVHLLFDPLQTIFNFENDHPDYYAFLRRVREKRPELLFTLRTPYRWKNAQSPLERHIPIWRNMFEDAINNGTYCVDLDKLPGVVHHTCNDLDEIRLLNSLVNKNSNILVLHSQHGSGNISIRGRISQSTGYKLRLIESVDNEAFYSLANSIDSELTLSHNHINVVSDIFIRSGCSKTAIEAWIKNGHIVTKHNQNDSAISEKLKLALENPNTHLAISTACRILQKEADLKVKRIELFEELLAAIESAANSGKSVEREIETRRNIARIQGRKLYGKVIGTTLLTKGLEADTVVLLKPSDLLGSRKGIMHLYVALTRAVRQIILIDITI